MANDPTRTETLSPEDDGPTFGEFSAATYDQWRKAAESALKGAPFDKRLLTQTYEGITLQPLYWQQDIQGLPHLGSLPGFSPYVRSTSVLGHQGEPWAVAQEMPYSTPAALNAALQADLPRGQTAVNLVLDPATRKGLDADAAPADDIGRRGVSISSLEDLGTALDRIDLEETPIFIHTGAMGLPIAALLMALVRKQAKSTERLRGCLGIDPLGSLATEGTLPGSLERAYDEAAHLTAWTIAHAPLLQTMSVVGHPYHDAGASATQELAFALASGVDYLRALQARDLAVDDVAPRMRFALSIGGNVFMEVAKLRAARLLWAKIVAAFGGNSKAQKLSIHARTSACNKTLYDPYVNMLRTTTEAFAGVVGGCNSLHVSPYDEVARAPNEFSRRIARNTHTILREECNIPRSIDPAGGSWYVEWLTDAVAKEAWRLFQEVEKQGGLFAALSAGFPQQQIAAVAAKRGTNAAHRRDVCVGTNMYANMSDRPLEPTTIDSQALTRERSAALATYRETVDPDWKQAALDKLTKAGPDAVVEAAIHAATGGATLGDLWATLEAADQPAPRIDALCIQRGAVPFEQLRDAAKTFAERTGSAPRAFLANLGPIPQHKARADFSRGFLEVGGFDVIGNDGFPDAITAANAAIESGAPIVVICSTDNTYPEFVPPLTQRIREAKPKTVILLAGYPADHIDAFQAAGVDDFIHLRANCYQLLASLQKKLGVLA
ncbi:MAG: methylmalonyl-CoA mutase family protein [Gammaproteobacteria bacterium]